MSGSCDFCVGLSSQGSLEAPMITARYMKTLLCFDRKVACQEEGSRVDICDFTVRESTSTSRFKGNQTFGAFTLNNLAPNLNGSSVHLTDLSLDRQLTQHKIYPNLSLSTKHSRCHRSPINDLLIRICHIERYYEAHGTSRLRDPLIAHTVHKLMRLSERRG